MIEEQNKIEVESGSFAVASGGTLDLGGATVVFTGNYFAPKRKVLIVPGNEIRPGVWSGLFVSDDSTVEVEVCCHDQESADNTFFTPSQEGFACPRCKAVLHDGKWEATS